MYSIVVLDNGIRLVYEKIPFVRSVALGVWVGTGSRNENPKNNGVSHFIEHMLFKGTSKRSAKDIAEEIDSVGGQINAFTGKECTCYYAKMLDTHLEVACDVLSDMFFDSKFTESDLEIERKVIFEEISMYEDSPEEMVHDILTEITWKENPLGYSILGTMETLGSLKRDDLLNYIGQNYHPANTVISVAGNFEESEMIDMVKRYFGGWKKEEKIKPLFDSARFEPSTLYKEKETEQVHICIGFEGIEHGSDDLYTLLAVNNILGGGMSSRLFQKVREEFGLVYSIYSYPSSYSNAGIFNIYAGMNPDCMEQVLKLIADEVYSMKSQGIKEVELAKTREQLKGNYILGLESTSSRMNSIGKSLLLLEKIYTPEEVLKRIDEITIESAVDVIKKVFDLSRISMAVVGRFGRRMEINEFLK